MDRDGGADCFHLLSSCAATVSMLCDGGAAERKAHALGAFFVCQNWLSLAECHCDILYVLSLKYECHMRQFLPMSGSLRDKRT